MTLHTSNFSFLSASCQQLQPHVTPWRSQQIQTGNSLRVPVCPLVLVRSPTTPEKQRTPQSPCPPQQRRALPVAESALPRVLKRGCGSVLLCLLQPASPGRVRGFPTLDMHPARIPAPRMLQNWVHAQDLQQWPEESLPSPLPPQLLNLFKLGERGEEVRPFGEVT